MRAIMPSMSDIESAASSNQWGYGAFTLRLSAAFCLLFWLFWGGQSQQISAELTRSAFFVSPYFLLMIHPPRWRDVLLGVAVGFSLATALLAELVNGFVRTREAKTVFLTFAAANFLLLFVSLRCWAAARKNVKGWLVLVFAMASFTYLWIVIS